MLSISQNVCRSVCPSVPVFTFEVPFKHLFAPTFWSQMSKSFRDTESLRKSYGKKCSQIWKLLLIKGGKLFGKKSFSWVNFAFLPASPSWANFASLSASLGKFCLTEKDFLVSVLLSISVRDSLSLYAWFILEGFQKKLAFDFFCEPSSCTLERS